ncbi:MAG: hypothetical protein AMJ55_07745 [Gammaproteobacteria bacterium SG8_15]|nr:MAG: hypothetical protein AMJ55_07745 [Gammaproteobacteria bacterium SG8_15]
MKLSAESDNIETLVSEQDSPLRERMLALKARCNEILNRDNPGEYLSWWIAEDAFELPAAVIEKLQQGGRALNRFFQVANALFYRERCIQARLEKRHTPNYRLLNHAQPGAIPLMPRPDVVLDEHWQPKFVELEITVCARFDTAAMNELYGLDINKGLIQSYANYYKQRWPGKTLALLTAPHPLWWYIVDEAIPFAERLRREGLDVVVLEGYNLPHLRFDGKNLLLCHRNGSSKTIHVIDRFIDIYELAELQHPGMAPIFDAYVAGAVASINTCKQFLDEKQWMCLFWDTQYRSVWRDALGQENDDLLRSMIPRTWEIHPDTRIELPSGKAITVDQLADLPPEERQFVIKESGTSFTSSGAQSLRVLSELSKEEVKEALTVIKESETQYVLQEIIRSPRISFTALNPNDNDKIITQHGARMKFSVFYMDGVMTNIKFIASNAEFAVNNRDCIEGIVRY